jgi:hypothetical protein
MGDPEHGVSLAFFFTQPAEVPDWNWGPVHISNAVLGALDE